MPRKKPKKYNLNSRLRAALRKLWLWSPMRAEALKAAKAAPALYTCAGCETTHRKVSVDHITPCGPIDDLNAFRDRLFCSADGLQVLCAECHAQKTVYDRAFWKKRLKSEEAH